MSISRRLAAHRQAMASAHGEAEPLLTETSELPGGDAEENTETPSITEKDQDMTDTTTAVAEAVTAERTRTNTVLACEHYAGREKLAANLLSTPLSAEDITAALAAAPKIEASSLLSAEEVLAAAEAAGRDEMKAALAEGRNSNIDAGASDHKVDPRAESNAVWDRAYGLDKGVK